MIEPGRNYSDGNSYRYGFNGKEVDKNISAEDYDYGLRIYDSRLGKFLSVDPLSKGFPWNSTYAYAENDVIRCIDLEGGEKYIITGRIWKGSDGKWLSSITIQTLPKPGPLGSGALYDIIIDNYAYTSNGRIGTELNAYAYMPSAQEQLNEPKERSRWNKFWDGILDGGAKDKGSGGGSHQNYGIIFTTKDPGMGATKTGCGDNADFFDVVDIDGLKGLVSGGRIWVMDASSLAKTHTAIKLIETAENGWEAAKTAIEGAHLLHDPKSSSPTTSTNNTKQGDINNVKKAAENIKPVINNTPTKIDPNTIWYPAAPNSKGKVDTWIGNDSAQTKKMWREWRQKHPKSKKKEPAPQPQSKAQY